MDDFGLGVAGEFMGDGSRRRGGDGDAQRPGGHAAPEARLRPLVLLALFLTPFSLLLFGDLLNLPIPIMPRFLQDQLLAGWGYRGALRLAAATMLVAGLILLMAGRRGRAASSEGSA